MDLRSLLRKEGQRLYWARLDDEQVGGRPSGDPIEPERHYVAVRLAEMYLGHSRVLWRKLSPLLHAFVKSGAGQEEHAVAGPGQLQQLGEVNLDRVLVLNLRLAGPIPYRGDELSIVAGLYSVPREDAAAALVTTLGALAGVAGPASAGASQIAQIVKSGVDSVLQLSSTTLRIGVLDTFGAAQPLLCGFHVGIGAPADEIPGKGKDLWLDEGRLMKGPRIAPQDFLGQDYFVVELERSDRRADWVGLPGIEAFNERFVAVMQSDRDVKGKASALNAMWPRFNEALRGSPYLTKHDAGEIAKDVEHDLANRLHAMRGGGPFETRAWGDDVASPQRPEDFDLAAVPIAEDRPQEATGPTPFA
jgi:hypothetical protein